MAKPASDKSQSSKFKRAARELGCDESEERFDAALRNVAKHKPAVTVTVKPKRGRKKGAPK